jgi:hypothetical protein
MVVVGLTEADTRASQALSPGRCCCCCLWWWWWWQQRQQQFLCAVLVMMVAVVVEAKIAATFLPSLSFSMPLCLLRYLTLFRSQISDLAVRSSPTPTQLCIPINLVYIRVRMLFYFALKVKQPESPTQTDIAARGSRFAHHALLTMDL